MFYVLYKIGVKCAILVRTCFFRARPPLKPGLKLAITMRFMATGTCYRQLRFNFRVPHNTISLFVPEVCKAIVEVFSPDVFQTPSTPDEWREVADGFRGRWNYANCCGAIDGKHVAIRKPSKTGSLHYCYKGFCSIVILALADSQYQFLWANVGSPGSNSDCGIYNRSPLKQAIDEGTIGFPDSEPLPGDDRNFPFFIVGDDAFALREHMMKPYSKRNLTVDERVHNYRTSRARRVVENAFGILAMRFRCLLNTMYVKPDTATHITKACMVLHNHILQRNGPFQPIPEVDQEDARGRLIPGAWRTEACMREVEDLSKAPRATAAGKKHQAYLKHYFMSEAGSVPWQVEAIERL